VKGGGKEREKSVVFYFLYSFGFCENRKRPYAYAFSIYKI